MIKEPSKSFIATSYVDTAVILEHGNPSEQTELICIMSDAVFGIKSFALCTCTTVLSVKEDRLLQPHAPYNSSLCWASVVYFLSMMIIMIYVQFLMLFYPKEHFCKLHEYLWLNILAGRSEIQKS